MDNRRPRATAADEFSKDTQPGGNAGYQPYGGNFSKPGQGDGNNGSYRPAGEDYSKSGPRDGNGNRIPPIPETIEQLQAWYKAHNLPPEEVTRFFIGRNMQEPRCFGIYRDGCVVIVYKNKNDGSRAIRYSGPDEKFAVNEIYQKLKLEIANQKANNHPPITPEQRRKQNIRTIIATVLIIALIGGWMWFTRDKQKSGYYHVNDDWYYYYGGAWYLYDDYGWQPYNYTYDDGYWDDYYYSNDYAPGNGYTDFAQTEYYSNTDTDSSWSSSDSWDSGSTDFSSDW